MTRADAARPLVSLIFPAYNEVENAPAMVDFFREIVAAYPAYDFEMIVVDDGSTDGTAEALLALAYAGEPLQVVSLSRNFGSHAAISAGFAHAAGDAAITLSADRQEPLSAIGQFLDEWTAGADLVWGLRAVRVQQQAVQGRFSRLFSVVFHRTSDVPSYPAEGPSQLLATRAVMDVVNAMPEANRNVLAMAAWVGFDQRRVYYDQLPRPYGVSKWTFRRKLKLVFDSFVEFSRTPVKWFTWVGLTLAGVGALLLIAALVMALLGLGGAAGVAAICGTVCLVGGINLVALGMLSEYTWRTADDARRRPIYVVKQVRRAGAADRSAIKK
ncbi:MAG: glycosyltransferase [Propionibacteriales bacterium]|nr:glycosyltransferase [Propionibacteriales bacterium]